jgi:Nif-specific regulatory protein
MTVSHTILDTLASVSGSRNPEELLRSTLELALRLVRGRLGYAALGRPHAPSWWVSSTEDQDVEAVRTRISSSIILAALREGRCVVTTSAQDDPRFREQASVRANGVRAVICAPLGAPDTPGVLYIEGAAGVRFSDAEISLVEGIARVTAQSTRNLLVRVTEEEDPTAPFRVRLKASHVIGRSPALADVLERLAAVAQLTVPVLVLGPSGSGKTALARVLHDSGPRAAARFVHVDCTQLKSERAQAELFGAVRGAYTGLDRDREGLVAEAEGGTLFLDEIGELPPEVQTLLLVFLDQQLYRRMGHNREHRANVRIVAATSRDPRVLVEPLFHRLSRWEIRVPPLTARRCDIPMLARALGARFARQEGIEPLEISDDALDALVHRDWSGHVRELENVVIKSILWALADNATVVRRSHVVHSDEPPRATELPPSDDLSEAVKQFRRDHAERVLRRCDGNKTAAATRLGVARETLYKILRGE